MEWKIEKNHISLLNEKQQIMAYVTFPEVGANTVDIAHTVVSPALRGQGIAGKLMEKLTEVLRADGRKAVLSCAYAVRWFNEHPENADVLAK